jgi:hypothetical protein
MFSFVDPDHSSNGPLYNVHCPYLDKYKHDIVYKEIKILDAINKKKCFMKISLYFVLSVLKVSKNFQVNI